MKYSVVMPCAGVGSRMNLGYNKLLFQMKNGKTVLENSMDVFLKDERLEEMILCVGKNDIETIQTLVSDARVKLVLGGATRQDSVYNGLKEVTSEYVLVHDGARPYLKKERIDDLLGCLEEHRACLLMVPTKDTIKVIKDGVVVNTPPRETLYNAQTPQAFHTKDILEAFIEADTTGFIGTDDASVMEACGKCKVHLILGDYDNIKITTPEDLKGEIF